MFMKKIIYCSLLVLMALLTACSTNKGKYYSNDGPPSSSWSLFGGMETDDAVPRLEKPVAATNRPYSVMGKKYYPVTGDKAMVQTGYGSWYGKKFHGKKTSTGEVYNMYAMTAAHTTMELPSYAKVTNLENGRSVIVRVNDRGPFLHNRVIDLSYAAAAKLGYSNKGTAKVRVERITRAQIASGKWSKGTSQATSPAVAAVTVPVATKVAAAQPIVRQQVTYQETEPSPGTVEALESSGVKVQPITTSEVVSSRVTEGGGAGERKYIDEGVFVMADGSTAVGKTETIVRSPAGGGFAVQLGAFNSEANAQGLARHVNEMMGENDPDARVVLINGINKVYVGRGLARENAQKLAAKVSDVVGLKGFVVKDLE